MLRISFLVPLHRVVVSALWLRSQFHHHCFPFAPVPGGSLAMPLHRQQVGVFVEQGLKNLVLGLKDYSAKYNFVLGVVGLPGGDP